MYSALCEKFGTVNYTGIDLDDRCIKNAKKRFLKAKFHKMNIFDKKLKKNSFDTVMMWNWSYMYSDWKKLFSQASVLIFTDIRRPQLALLPYKQFCNRLSSHQLLTLLNMIKQHVILTGVQH